MKFAKTIKMFLLDGDPNSRISCELSNWTGKAYKIPRSSIKICSDRSDLKNTGIYLLFGKSEEATIKDVVYIGEAEDIFKRLLQHLKEKDYWQEAIVIISKDDNLNKAHIKYLEYKVYDLAQKATRYKIQNNQTPTKSSISESDEAEMEEFLHNIRILVSVLGYKVFEDLRNTQNISEEESVTFSIKAARGADAKGKPVSDGFVVFKNSKISDTITDSFFESMRNLRENLIEEKIILQNKNGLFFKNDHLFSSASTAAMIVMGRSANGLTEWKLKDGKTLKEFENS